MRRTQDRPDLPIPLDPDYVAERVLSAMDDATFLVLPNPEVLTYFQRKANDYERWLRGMRRLVRPSPAEEVR